jgi:hypothetical protein
MSASIESPDPWAVLGLGRHRVIVPFILGMFSGVTLAGLIVWGAMAGFLIGRSPAAGRGVVIGSLGSIVSSSVMFAWLALSMVSSDCPSCVDAAIFGWMVTFLTLVPFLIGGGIGVARRQRRKEPRPGDG